MAAVSERRVLIETVERRTGLTRATRLGQLPVAFVALLELRRRAVRTRAGGPA